MLASIHGNVSPVWPATGLSIWLLIVFGRSLWPAIAVGAFVANALTNIPLGVAATIALGNTLEAVAGAWLWRRVQERVHGIQELRDLLSCLVASLLAPVASATAGVASLLIAGSVPMSAAGKLWGTWWSGDALGALTVLPALLAAPEFGRLLRAASAREAGKGVLLLAAIAGVSWLAFMLPGGAGFLFAFFPVLLLAMTWFGSSGARWTALLIPMVGITAAYFGHGPFTTGEANRDLLNLQVFLAVVTITALVLPVFGTGRNSRLPVAILLLGWTLSGWVFAMAQREALRGQQELLGERIAAAETSIRSRMATYEETLRGGVGLFAASKSVDRHEWREYVESLQLEKRYPGVDSLGVVFPVGADATEWLAQVRADGAPDFSIRSIPGGTVPPDGMKYVVTYLEPEETHRSILGLDHATEGNRRFAAQLARDTGEPRMTGQVMRVNDDSKRPGFLLYVPIYQKNVRFKPVAERRAAFIGWVFARFFNEDFFNGVLGSIGNKFHLCVFESGRMDREHLLFASSKKDGDALQNFERVTELELAGRHFQLGWRRGPNYPGAGTSPMVWAAASFAFATLFLAGLVASSANLSSARGAAGGGADDRAGADAAGVGGRLPGEEGRAGRHGIQHDCNRTWTASSASLTPVPSECLATPGPKWSADKLR